MRRRRSTSRRMPRRRPRGRSARPRPRQRSRADGAGARSAATRRRRVAPAVDVAARAPTIEPTHADRPRASAVAPRYRSACDGGRVLAPALRPSTATCDGIDTELGASLISHASTRPCIVVHRVPRRRRSTVGRGGSHAGERTAAPATCGDCAMSSDCAVGRSRRRGPTRPTACRRTSRRPRRRPDVDARAVESTAGSPRRRSGPVPHAGPRAGRRRSRWSIHRHAADARPTTPRGTRHGDAIRRAGRSAPDAATRAAGRPVVGCCRRRRVRQSSEIGTSCSAS